MSSSKPTFGDNVYNATASFGKAYTSISNALLVLVGVGLLIAGIYVLYKSITTSRRLAVQGKVEVVSPCTVTYGKRSSVTKCPIRVWYAVNGSPYETTIVENHAFQTGDPVSVYVDPKDPSIAYQTDGKDYTAGLVCLGGSVLCFLIAYVTQRAVRDSKGLAAYMGISAIF